MGFLKKFYVAKTPKISYSERRVARQISRAVDKASELLSRNSNAIWLKKVLTFVAENVLCRKALRQEIRLRSAERAF